MLDDIKIDPFESAFGFRSDINNVKVLGDIKQGICATFHTHRPSIALQIDQTSSLTVIIVLFRLFNNDFVYRT